MKNFSFKKVLAVTLAAATALTFAPVSTLGLTGVVEAQAAQDVANAHLKSITDAETALKTAQKSLADADTAIGASPSGNIEDAAQDVKDAVSKAKSDFDAAVSAVTDAGTAATAVGVTITAPTETINNTDGQTLSAIKTSIGTAKDQVDALLADTSATNEITDAKAAAQDKVKAEKATTVKFQQNGEDVTQVEGKVGNTISVNAVFTNGASSQTFQLKSNNDFVATVSGTTTGTATSQVLTITPVAVGSTQVVLKVDGKEYNLDVVILGDRTETSISAASQANASLNAQSEKVADVVVNGSNLSSTVTANNPTAPSNPTVKAVKGTDTRKDIADGDITATLGTATVTSDGTQASFPLQITNIAAKIGDQYDVTVTDSAVTSSAKRVTIRVTIVSAAADTTFTTGGVLTDILAYKGASYDLAEHAAVKYTAKGSPAVNLSGSELTWYLVDKTKKPAVGEARADLKSMNIDASTGTIESGVAGSMKVTVADKGKFVDAVDDKANLVAEAVINGVRTVVYVSPSTVKVDPINTDNVAAISNVIDVSVQGTGKSASDNKIGVLDNQIANPTQDNKYLKASQITYPAVSATDDTTVQTSNKYSLTVVKASGDDNPFKGSYLNLSTDVAPGIYYETAYIPFRVNGDSTNTTYIQKVTIKVSVNTGVNFRVKDGGSILATTYSNDTLATDSTVYLNLVNLKTWNIKDYIETDAEDASKVTYSFRSDSANVDVKDGLLTAKSVGNAIIYIKATYNNITTVEVPLQVRVNKNAFDTITVTGKDGDVARVLAPRDYDNNSIKVVDTEEKLVTKQIPYVQIEIRGNETSNVTETPVVKSSNNAKLSYAFVKDYSGNGLTIDPSTGKITIDYTKCTNGTDEKAATAMGVYAVKVVSTETASSATTTSYYYVVVDYNDQKINGLQNAYTVGACADNTHSHATAVALLTESNSSAKNFRVVDNNATDDFYGIDYYKNDNKKAFDNADVTSTSVVTNPVTGLTYTTTTTSTFEQCGVVTRAYASGQTEHVLAYNKADYKDKAGYTAKLITMTSAAAVDNYVAKIVNKATGDVLYDYTVDGTDTAKQLTIDKETTIQVTLAHPVASVVSGSAVHLSISDVDSKSGDVINQNRFVTAVKNTAEVDVRLFPNEKGTQVIAIGPTGHLTATDRTDIHHKAVQLAVTYTGKKVTTDSPAKVSGLKVSNKKGAKVTVKFNKVTTYPTMRYYVQKKIGKKTSGKSVGSTKTTLSVGKGKTVKVRVKAYYYDQNGTKHVGKYSSWKTLKTDKK